MMQQIHEYLLEEPEHLVDLNTPRTKEPSSKDVSVLHNTAFVARHLILSKLRMFDTSLLSKNVALDPAKHVFWLEDLALDEEFQQINLVEVLPLEYINACECQIRSVISSFTRAVKEGSLCKVALVQEFIRARVSGCMFRGNIYIERSQCKDAASLLATMVHEMIHWYRHVTYEDALLYDRDADEGITETLTLHVLGEKHHESDDDGTYEEERAMVASRWPSLGCRDFARALFLGEVEILGFLGKVN